VLDEVGAGEVPAIEVFNKCDLLGPVERERLEARQPSALCIAALRGEGRAELLDLLASRLALDTSHVRLDFDASREDERRRIAELYRHARIVSHVTSNGRVTIEAEVPRRLLATMLPRERMAPRPA
jgi:GTP-binding protein HflX